MSIGASGQSWVIHTRPPIRSRPSSTVTLKPRARNARAAAIPDIPAPMTSTFLFSTLGVSFGEGAGVGLLVGLQAARRVEVEESKEVMRKVRREIFLVI